MSLITQCPACSTLFKVVPDQLRISDGWVRCGQCDEVFDANENIRADVAAADAQDQPQAPSDVEPIEAGAVDISIEAIGTPPAPTADSVAPEEVSVPGLRDQTDPFLNKSPRELSDFSAAVSAASAQDELHGEVPLTGTVAERRYKQIPARDAEVQEDPKLSFIKPVRPASVWKRRGVRVALSVCSIFLAVSLMLQVVVHERNRLAVHYPEFRNELATLCVALGLEIEPLRQIESVVIDSSAFSKVRNEVYKLNFTLRNTSATALATPAMELTLTDMQDQVMLRRVLMPADFAGVPAVMNAGVEVTASLPVSVRAPIVADRVSGYRLLAFYP